MSLLRGANTKRTLADPSLHLDVPVVRGRSNPISSLASPVTVDPPSDSDDYDYDHTSDSEDFIFRVADRRRSPGRSPRTSLRSSSPINVVSGSLLGVPSSSRTHRGGSRHPRTKSRTSVAYLRSHQALMDEMLPSSRQFEDEGEEAGEDGKVFYLFGETERRRRLRKKELARARVRLCLSYILPLVIFCVCFTLLVVFIVALVLLASLSHEIKLSDVGPAPSLQALIEPSWIADTPGSPPRWIGGSSCATAVFQDVQSTSGRNWGVFLFSDSMIGYVMNGSQNRPLRVWTPDECDEAGFGTRCGVIHNAVGIVELGDQSDDELQQKKVDFFWKNETGTGNPLSFVTASSGKYYYGFDHGIVLFDEYSQQQHLYIFSPRYLRLNNSRKLPPPSDGVVVIRCGPLSDQTITDPNSWDCSEHPLPETVSSKDNGYQWGASGGIVINSLMYLFGVQTMSSSEGEEMFLARIPLDSLRVFDWGSIEFWCGNGVWKTGKLSRVSSTSSLVLPKGLTGLPQNFQTSVHYNDFLGKFVIVENKPMSNFNSYLFTSRALTGPFSSYYMYSIGSPFSEYEREMFAYSFKNHNHLTLAGDDEMVFTYVVNSEENFNSFAKLFPEFYVPQFIKAKLIKKRKPFV